MTLKLLPLAFLLACGGPHRFIKKEYITLSESPCIDGTILNIDQAGCESFYWGTDVNQKILKVRCTYAPEDNWWTGMAFYAIPHDTLIRDTAPIFCTDIYVHMYAVPRDYEFEIK